MMTTRNVDVELAEKWPTIVAEAEPDAALLAVLEASDALAVGLVNDRDDGEFPANGENKQNERTAKRRLAQLEALEKAVDTARAIGY
jgi:hypothetical protein